MGKFRLYPFDKNNYFYGKLLTVRDFKAEQEYNSGKSRMVNRLLFGSGVVAGLRTTMIDSRTISVESGVAIDNLGREIVVSRALTEKMEVIEGFNTYKDARILYLCLQYDESGSERIHSLTNEVSVEAGLSDYNRIREGFKLKILAEPEAGIEAAADGHRRRVTVHRDERLTVAISVPEAVNPGEVFCIEVDVEKAQIDTAVSFELNFEAAGAETLAQGQDMVVRFKEPEEGKSGNYSTRIWVAASALPLMNAWVKPLPGSSSLWIDGEKLAFNKQEPCVFDIVEENLFKRSQSQLEQKPIDERIEKSDFEHIYLARIHVLKTEGVYYVMRVEPMPFKQWVYDTATLYEGLKALSEREGFDITTQVELEQLPPNGNPQVDVKYQRENRSLNFAFKLPQNQLLYDNIVTGIWEFTVDENFKFGKNFVSEDLNHGLGKGPAYIELGLDEAAEGLSDQESSRIFYGSPEVFFKTDQEPKQSAYAFGSVLYPNKGTFKIGMRIQNGKKGDMVRVRWWAYKCLTDIRQEERIKIKLEPSEAKIKTGESIKLSAVITGDSTCDIRWELEDARFGTLDDMGFFQAGESVGTAVVKAISNVDPTVSGMAYISIEDVSRFDKAKEKFKF